MEHLTYSYCTADHLMHRRPLKLTVFLDKDTSGTLFKTICLNKEYTQKYMLRVCTPFDEIRYFYVYIHSRFTTGRQRTTRLKH